MQTSGEGVSPTTHPKLRRDLVISRQETPGGLVFVVKDPLVGRFVRLKEPEYFIAQQLDGATPLEEVRRRGEERFGAALSETTLQQFTQKLLTLGLLDHTEQQERGHIPKQKPARVLGNPFYLRFKIFDPDRLFERLIPRLSFLFSRQFAWFSLAIILLATGVMITSWQEIHHSFHRLYRIETVILAWITFTTIVIGHEFSHGLTCKRFGGKVHEVGLLLIYLQPGMYCNVSDAWLFPEKGKRLLVTLAGAWFEIFCWAIATLLWRVTDPATLLNYLALVVATTLGIKSLFNLNPLIKLDGYYLLSDYLEVPNLRKNAFQYIGARIKALWRPLPPTFSPSPPTPSSLAEPEWERGAVGGEGHERFAQTSRRERRIYWLYGVLAAAYSTWLMSFLLLSLGAFLVRRYQSWGFIFFAAVVLGIFRFTLGRWLRFLASLFGLSHGILPVVKRALRIAVVVAVAGACLYFIRTELRISGEFKILPNQNADVRAEVEGIIEEIVHDEGDMIGAGEVIARLSDRDYRAELEKIKAEIAEKEARLKLLKAGARPEEIELAETTMVKNAERLKYARTYLEMEKSLYEEKLSSKKDFEVAEELVALRAKELDESKGNLKLLLAGSRPETIEATQAEVTRLVSQQKYLEGQLQRLRIVSPIGGIITTHRLKEKVGANLKKGDLIAEVHELQTVTAEISVPEKEISDVRVGQPVVLKARAHLGTSFRGNVLSITPVASKPAEGLAQREFLVITKLDNRDLKLKAEMTGNAKISCGTRRLYEIVFRRFIRFIRVEFWSWW